MALDAKFGHFSVPGVGEDEPIFIIRARDALSVPALNSYYDLAEEAGCSDRVLEGVQDAESNFKDWQDWHETRRPE